MLNLSFILNLTSGPNIGEYFTLNTLKKNLLSGYLK